MLFAAVAAALVAMGPIGAAAPEAQSTPARTAHLTAAQMFRLAEQARDQGDFGTAAIIYSALERDPNSDIRAEARFRYAKQLLAQQRNREAALLLRRLVDEKPGAAAARLELAHVLQLLGDPDAALREVRAVQASGLPAAVARLVDRYSEALRAQRPFGASFEIAFAPDSNINAATRADTLGTVLGDFAIAPEAKAKSGTGMSLHTQAYSRLPLSEDSRLLLRVSGFANLYRDKRFNDIAADIAAGPEIDLGRSRLQVELGATQRWYGQKPFMRSARLAATFSKPLGSRMLLRLETSAALVDNRMNDLEDGKIFSGQLSIERALSSTTGIVPSITVDRQSLKDGGYSNTGWRAGVTAWRDMGRMTLTAGAEFGRLAADDRLMLFPHKREDHYSRFSIGATFRQIQFRGFAPVARFSIERNRSSIGFYDYRRTRSEIGVVHAF